MSRHRSSPCRGSPTSSPIIPDASVTADRMIPDFFGAVCPSCHREIHHGLHGQAKNEALIEVISQKEAAPGA